MFTVTLKRDSAGNLLIDKESLCAMGLEPAGELVLTQLVGNSALLTETGIVDQLPMAIFTSSIFSTSRIMYWINDEKKNGILSFLCEDFEKKIFFTRGDVVFASSTLKEDRLGNILWRNGLITLDALNEVASHAGKGKVRLGELLMHYGKLKPRDIYVGLTFQVREIFLSSFCINKGIVVFTECDHKEKNSVRLRELTRDLILEGKERSKELEDFRMLVPDDGKKFKLCKPRTRAELNERENRVLSMLIDGKNIGDIGNESKLGEYETLKTVARLIQLGLINSEGRETPFENDRDRKVHLLLGALTLCYRELQARGPMGSVHLDSYLENPPAFGDLLGGLTFDSSGSLDKNMLIERASMIYGAFAADKITEALDELIQYSIFEIKNSLRPQEAEVVIKKVLAVYDEA